MNSNDPFEMLVNEHYEPLFRFAMSLTRSEADAQDLTQQTFYTWATKGHQLRDNAKAKSWLFTTMHRAFLTARRRQLRFPHHELDEVTDQLPALSHAPDEHADFSQVLPALAKVNEAYQAAVALFYLEDYSYQEIAEILEVPCGTVKSRIARGVAQLKVLLTEVGFRGSSPRSDWDLSASRLGEQTGIVANPIRQTVTTAGSDEVTANGNDQ